MSDSKTCNVCNEVRPLSAFHARKASVDGLAYTCRACAKEACQKHYAAKKEAYKSRARAWSEANPERRSEIRRASAEKHIEKKRVVNRERNRRIRIEQPDRARTLGKVAAHNRRVRMDAAGRMDPEVARLVLAAANGLCVYCGVSAPLTLDHLEPVSRGGDNGWENLLACCKPCNSRKATQDLADWVFKAHGVMGLVRVLHGIKVAKKVIRRLRPEAVIGFPIREV